MAHRPRLSFRFVILCSGFVNRTLERSRPREGAKLRCPSLHIVGEADAVDLEALYDEFEPGKQRVLVKHQGGHFLPSSDPFVRKYRKFLASFLPRTDLSARYVIRDR